MWLVPPELKFLYFLCQIISSLTTYLTTYPVVNHRTGGCELFLLLKTKYPDGNHVTDSSKLSNTSDLKNIRQSVFENSFISFFMSPKMKCYGSNSRQSDDGLDQIQFRTGNPVQFDPANHNWEFLLLKNLTLLQAFFGNSNSVWASLTASHVNISSYIPLTSLLIP